MKTGRLIRVEFYRFYKYFGAFAIMLALFVLSLYGFAVQGDSVTVKNSELEYLYMSISMGNFLIPLLAAVMIGTYVGREFDLKTINYEIMQGYGYVKICLIKTITSGIIIPCVVFFCIFFFISIVQGEGKAYSTSHYLVMGILLLRVFACTVLYVMLTQNGGQGGFFSFLRYTLLETTFNLLKLFSSSGTSSKVRLSVSFTAGWGKATVGNGKLESGDLLLILTGTVAEFLALLLLAYLTNHHGIKERRKTR